MDFRFISLFFLGLLLTGCNPGPKTPVSKPVEFDREMYAKQLQKERDSIQNLNKNSKSITKITPDSTKVAAENQSKIKVTTDTIPVKIVYGKAKIDTVKAAGQRLVFVLNSDTANKLFLKITPKDSLANLRITQIIDSQNNSDGPFGREIEFSVKNKGVQKIVISENQMAGEPWAGAFSFEVKLGW